MPSTGPPAPCISPTRSGYQCCPSHLTRPTTPPSGMQAAAHTHDALLRSVLRAPMAFFDSVPHGRILNRWAATAHSAGTTAGKSHTVAPVLSRVVLLLIWIKKRRHTVWPSYRPALINNIRSPASPHTVAKLRLRLMVWYSCISYLVSWHGPPLLAPALCVVYVVPRCSSDVSVVY